MKSSYENGRGTPSANNTTSIISIKELFAQKDLYDQKYPNFAFRPQPVKISSTMRSLYGRVDTSGFSVIPKDEFITQIPSEAEQIFSLTIVKECFEEMTSYWHKLGSLGKLSKNSTTLKVLEAKSAITSGLRILHKSYLRDKIEFFNKEFVRNDAQIKNYIDYEKGIRNFTHHLRGLSSPFTLSQFCVSTSVSPTETGMVIDIAQADPSEDAQKYQEFIADPNFENYTKAAYRFGFKVDKDIPWRLYFDLSSKYAKEKMASKGIYRTEEFFKRYHVRAVDVEFPDIVESLASMYRRYTEFSPSYQEIKPCPTSLSTRSAYSQAAAKVLTREKEVLTGEILGTRYGTDHWLRLYAYIRSVETSSTWTQKQFDTIVEESANLYLHRSAQHALYSMESVFTDKTLELFSQRGLTDENSFDTMITGFKF